MTIDLLFTQARELFTGTSIFGLNWIMLVMATGLTLFMITREISSWKHLAFPVIVGWYTAGIKSGSLFDAILMVAAGAMFTIEALSVSTASKIIETVRERALDITTRTTKMTRDIMKEQRLVARSKAYGDVFKRTSADMLRKDIIKAAGKVRGMGILQDQRRRKITAKQARELQKERRLEELETKAKTSVTRHAMDMAPARRLSEQIEWDDFLHRMEAEGVIDRYKDIKTKKGMKIIPGRRLKTMPKGDKFKQEVFPRLEAIRAENEKYRQFMSNLKKKTKKKTEEDIEN